MIVFLDFFGNWIGKSFHNVCLIFNGNIYFYFLIYEQRLMK